jgi:HSP20 family protein
MPDLIPRDFFDEPRWPMRRLRRLFDEPLAVWPGWETEGAMEVDVYRDEEQNAIVAKASLPGFTKEEIEVHVEHGVLAIQGEHREEKEVKEEHYFRRERRYGAVHRRVALPGTVESDQATAELKDGVLTVTVPLAEEAKPKRVDVKAG